MNDKLSRKEREAAHHRSEILEAAEQVFVEKGYVSVSMEEVAQRAEFAVGTLYKFFRSKEELYSEIILRKSFLYAPRIEKTLSQKVSPLEKIKTYYLERLNLFWEDPKFFRLFFHQTMSTVCDQRAGFKPQLIELYKTFLEKLKGVFEEGIRRHIFYPFQSITHVLLFEGMLRVYMAHLSRMDHPLRNQEEERAIWDYFIRGAVLPSHSAYPLPRSGRVRDSGKSAVRKKRIRKGISLKEK